MLQLWNDAQVALSNAASVGSLFSEVHPDKAVRERAEKVAQDVQKLDTDLGLDTELYAVLAGVDPAGLDADATRVLERTLRDFRRSGVDRDEATRARLRELSERAVLLSQEFSKNIREDVRSIRVRPEQLAGMPADWIAAHPAGDDGLVTITTDYPDVVPFRTFAHDAQARRDLVTQFLTIAWPANDRVLQDIFAVRPSTPRCSAMPSWAGYDAEVKMIGSGSAIGEFIDRITELSASLRRARQGRAARAAPRRTGPTPTDIDGADSTYYAEVVRKEQLAVDAQRCARTSTSRRCGGPARRHGAALRPRVVPVPTRRPDLAPGGRDLRRVLRAATASAGSTSTCIRATASTSTPPSSTSLEGASVGQLRRGCARLQLQPRSDGAQRGRHAVPRVRAPRPPRPRRAHDWVRFSGVATEWDFVEAPSQMLEEWAWDADVLATFARNEDGEPIPADLVERDASATTSAGATTAAPRCSTHRCPTTCTSTRPTTSPPELRELQAALRRLPFRRRAPTSSVTSATSPATHRRTTRTCGAW